MQFTQTQLSNSQCSKKEANAIIKLRNWNRPYGTLYFAVHEMETTLFCMVTLLYTHWYIVLFPCSAQLSAVQKYMRGHCTLATYRSLNHQGNLDHWDNCMKQTTILVMCGDITTDRSALKVVNKHWTQLLEEQDFLATPEGWRKMLALVPDKTREALEQEWQETETTSITKWRRLLREVKVNMGSCF